MTLLLDVSHPGSQEHLVSNWEPACSLVEDAVSGAEIASCLPALAIASLPLCLRWGEGPIRSRLVLLWYSLSPLFCEWAWQCLRLELFTGKFSLSLSFFLSGYPTVWVAVSRWLPRVALSAFPPGSYLKQCSPCLPVQPLLAAGGGEHLGYFSTRSYG